jgi:ABC-type transporter Mla MlaB component
MTTDRSLPSELTIYTVGELHPQWLAWLADVPAADAADVDTFAVDAAAVAEVDAAGVQLLLSLQRSLSARKQALRLVAPSRTLATACTALGLAAELGTAELCGAAA